MTITNVLLSVVVIVIAGLAFFYYTKKKKEQKVEATVVVDDKTYTLDVMKEFGYSAIIVRDKKCTEIMYECVLRY